MKRMTQKILFNAPDDMYMALKSESTKRQTPMSALIRVSIAEWLGYQGYEVTKHVEWGGKRDGHSIDTNTTND
jgi:hypothetical protein